MTEPATGTVRDDRRTFLRCRHRALVGSAGVLVALIALAAVFVAPNRLASLQLGEVALAWWVAAAVALTGLVAVVRGFRGVGPTGIMAGTSRLTPLALRRAVGARPRSGSPFRLSCWPTALADSGRRPCRRGHHDRVAAPGDPMERTGGLMVSASTLARTLAGAWSCQSLLASIETVVVGLFVWACAGRYPRGWRDGRLAPRGDDAGRGLWSRRCFCRISRGSG